MQPNYTKQLAEIADALHRAPQQPDYSRQLDGILAALNRHSPPQWVYLVLGALLTLLVQFLVRYIEGHRKRWKMRKIIYSEIARMFASAQVVQGTRPDGVSLAQHWKWQADEISKALTFDAEGYWKKEVDTFIDLRERYYIEAVYRRFHRILDDQGSFNVNLGLALRVTSEYFTDGSLYRRWVKRCLRPQGISMLNKMSEIDRDTKHRQADSGA